MKRPKMTILLLGAFLAAGSAVLGQTSLSLSPIQLDLKIAAGRSQKATLVVGNDSYDVVRIRTEAENWTIDHLGSEVLPSAEASRFSCRDWIRTDDPEFELKSGDFRKVSFTVSVPSETEPGQYLAAISFKTMAGDAAKDRSAVSIQGRLIAVVFITVGGPKAEGSIADLTVEKKNGRNVFIVRVKNSGRTFLSVSGKIDLRDVKKKKVAGAEVPEDIVPPLSERLMPVAFEKEIPPGNYEVSCVLRLPSRKTWDMKKNIIID